MMPDLLYLNTDDQNQVTCDEGGTLKVQRNQSEVLLPGFYDLCEK